MPLFAANPFVSAYLQSDWGGKLIFWGLFLLSIVSWSLILYKGWVWRETRKASIRFASQFPEESPLNWAFPKGVQGKFFEVPHPYFAIYRLLKEKALTLLTQQGFLSEADIGMLESLLSQKIISQMKQLEKHLFLLPTIVTLAPFLGLLGTVWGILLTFSSLHAKGVSLSNAEMLSGLSLALATTVAGLLIVIPTLIGYNILKNIGKEYRSDLEAFKEELLFAVEIQHRRSGEKEMAPLS